MESTEPVVAVVVAAGAGVRLGGETPKALREVAGRTLVRHSLDGLAGGGVDQAVVVIAPGERAAFETALADSPIPAAYVFGGARRQDSVRAGLTAIAGDPKLSSCRFVLVHDAARALVPPAMVARVIAALRAGAVGCVPVLPVVDSIRHVSQNGDSAVVDRTALRAVQTPQGFVREALAAALARADEAGLEVSDDATALEAMGSSLTLVEGAREALKVTEPADLLFVEAIARSR
jgi:2-C-methyl-D-erythritol 4-phosphate cytidylyltransferase